uniref:F-box domain-containing protein n=2 Tax=Proconiini TaxID=565685 RepID=A0A1B6IH04_9HEMI
MDEQNGDCFDHHEMFAPLSSSDTEHDCLKDFLLDPPRHEQHSMSSGYCYDNMQASSGLMSMSLNSGLSMTMGSGMTMAGPGMSMTAPSLMAGGSAMSMAPGQGMSMSAGPNLTMSSPLGSPMNCGLSLPPNVGMTMNSGPLMPMAGSSGMAMSQNSCMPITSSTNLSIPNIPNQVLSSSSLSLASNSGMSPGMPLPMSTGSHTMSTCSPILMSTGHSLPLSTSSNRPLMDHLSPIPIPNLSSCVNDNSMMMHQGYSSSNAHIPQLQSPVQNQAAHPVVDFRSPGHSVESVIPSALDNGVISSECCDKNGEWSPAGTGDSVRTGESQEGVEPGTSERTVSSDCVSSETVCSPEAEGIVDQGNEERKLKQETRGRKRKTSKQPRQRKSPSTIATYQSQISPDQNGIKIRIKKSLTLAPQKTRKRKNKQSEEIDEYEEPLEQSPWGDRMPKKILNNIFYMVTKIEGCVPFLVRMSRVCRLWRDVAVSPHLWYHIDLASTWCRDRVKNDRTFQWLCENRLAQVQELNLGGWSFTGIPSVLDKMATSCVKLQGLGLSGLQGLSLDNIKFLVSNCPYLERLDLSSINPELNSPRSAVSMASLLYLAQTMGERLTHLILANNKLAGVPQILTAIATHCPNLQVLDLANVRTVAQTTAYIHIEKLQEGCPSLRVLRLTNSQLALSPVSFNEQATSQGFPQLEELSVAGVVEGLTSQPYIDDEALQRIIKSSKKLRLLDVRGCNKVSDSSLVRVPAWDLEHIFLSGCYVTRLNDSGLELIVKKWSHSLVEVDLAWSTATEPLDAAITALAEQGGSSRLRTLDLCGSSVSLEPVRAVLTKCPLLSSINLSSCRALPRGMKRLYQGLPLVQLRSSMLTDQ